MKILVIGGTGNISRWFVPLLVRRGHSVTLFNRGQHEAFFDEPVVTLRGDRTRYTEFENRMREAGTFDCVIDMIGFEPDDAHSAVRAFSGRTGQYIFCSTVDVFDKQPESYPVSERGVIRASPTFPYAHKKVQMEEIFVKAFHEKKFPVTILRPAATYSEGWSPLVTCFGGQTYHLDRLRKHMPVVLHGDGSAIWVSCHSEDVARAFSIAAGNSATIGNAYNLAGDELMTWRSMYNVVADVLQAPSPEFVYIPTDMLARLAPEASAWCVENFQFNNIFDNTLAKETLAFRQTISFREGAARCIGYLQQRNLIEDASRYTFYDDIVKTWQSHCARMPESTINTKNP